jgi:choline dehydrogenase-like flavoprotein
LALKSHEVRAQVLVIGSGAGGSITALELARSGVDVLLVEEGRRHALDDYGRNAAHAMRTLYRRRGMTPILGSVPIGYVEGRCLGGSTEINSAFWHRTPPLVAAAWKERFGLTGVEPDVMAPHFDWLELALSVSPFGAPLPSMTELFRKGAGLMHWSPREVPRVVRQCACLTPCSSGCRSGGKQSMSRSLLPQAEAAGARIVTGCRAHRLIRKGRRVVGAEVTLSHDDISENVRIEAGQVVVCCGPTETPSLLRRSGITHQVGTGLQIHPMLKVAARFPFETGAATQPIPLMQINGPVPRVSIGGAHFSAGHLALHMSENWPVLADRMADRSRMAMFHVAVRGSGRGSVSPAWLGSGTRIRYELSAADHSSLCLGAANLVDLLFQAGAEEVYPAIHGVPVIGRDDHLRRTLDGDIRRSALSLTTVHAFSTCRAGERRFRTAVNSYGRVWDFDNLFVNDASILPDSPGVNPQGSIMALARRNALHMAENLR